MFVMTHGTVVINMILLLAAQDGLVMRPLDNALWPTQEMDSVASQDALNTADHTQLTLTDATPPAIPAMSAKLATLDAAQTGPLNVEVAVTQIQMPTCSSVIRLTQIIHNV